MTEPPGRRSSFLVYLMNGAIERPSWLSYQHSACWKSGHAEKVRPASGRATLASRFSLALFQMVSLPLRAYPKTAIVV